MRTEAQKKANKKYDSLHYKVISGKAKIQDVEQYKKKAAKYSITIKLNQSGTDIISDIQDNTSNK